MEEAERLGAEARRAEEERLQKAIEEAQKHGVRPVFSQNYILWHHLSENHVNENHY